MTNSIRAHGPLIIASLLLAAGCNRTATPPAEKSVANPGCIGCSADGKTTPRTAEGRPDLNGFWSGAAPNPSAPTASPAAPGGRGNPTGFGFRGGVMQRYADGSIIYDPSTEYNAEDGAGRICMSDDCQAPNQPPYNAEWMAKVRKIAATQFGGTTPLDPVHDCRPLGVPRAGVNGIHVVQTDKAVT